MKTPEEIKRGLEHCNGSSAKCGDGCPYCVTPDDDPCWATMEADALAYIRELEAERDAAIADMEKMQGNICQACKYYYQPDPTVRKWSCRVLGEYWADIFEHDGGLLMCGTFEWRGVQDDERRPD